MNREYQKGLLFCIVATVSWGIMFPIMTDALRHIDPYTFTSLRYGFASIAFALALLRKEGRKAFNLRGERIGLAWLLGTIGFVGFGFLVFLGQKLAGRNGALIASIMMATMPMLGFLVNWILRKVTPPFVSFGFILMSFFGVVTVITKGDYLAIIEHPANYAANALILMGALCWVVYTVGASFFAKWSPYRYTAITTLFGITSVFLLNILFFATGFVPVPRLVDLEYIAPHVAYMALIAGFVGVLCWNFGNKILTPLNGVLFMDVVPITAFVVSSLQGVTPARAQIVGATITGTALVFNNLYMRRHVLAGMKKAASAIGATPVRN